MPTICPPRRRRHGLATALAKPNLRSSVTITNHHPPTPSVRLSTCTAHRLCSPYSKLCPSSRMPFARTAYSTTNRPPRVSSPASVPFSRTSAACHATRSCSDNMAFCRKNANESSRIWPRSCLKRNARRKRRSLKRRAKSRCRPWFDSPGSSSPTSGAFLPSRCSVALTSLPRQRVQRAPTLSLRASTRKRTSQRPVARPTGSPHDPGE